jgi:CHAT domain-containing protein
VLRGPAASPQRIVQRGSQSYLALVLRHGVRPAVVPLGRAEPVDALVARWRAAIVGEIGATAPGRATTAVSWQSGIELRRRVWDPVVVHTGAAARVFIVPDGALNLLPFAALPTSATTYLVETGPTLHYLAAERDLVSTADTSANVGLLAIGGPSFDDQAAAAASGPKPSLKVADENSQQRAVAACDFQSVAFKPLTETGKEVEDLAALWLGSRQRGGAATVLTGAKATESAVKREASRYRVLHIATHGFFLGANCAPASPQTRGIGGLTDTGDTPNNPFLLSGLALAGANRRASVDPDQDDGILMSGEVAALDLKGVEWAVLSACDTGVGEIRAGEGVFGLRRAFQVAGVRTVIMSLWSVEDASARRWMHALYDERFGHQMDTAAAVRRASVAALHERRRNGQSTSPFYWAPFVAAGDWR